VPQDPPDWVLTRRREIGQRLRARRLHANLSMERLGEQVRGVDRRTVSAWEYGTSDPTLTDLLLIAAALGLDPADLIADPPRD
jgi:transcriptional regulator with XRE-family HTH domain